MTQTTRTLSLLFAAVATLFLSACQSVPLPPMAPLSPTAQAARGAVPVPVPGPAGAVGAAAAVNHAAPQPSVNAVASRVNAPTGGLTPQREGSVALGVVAGVLAGVGPSVAGNPAVAMPDSLRDMARDTLRAAPDLWGHLRRGFAVPVLDHELVNAHAHRFAANGFLAARADRVRLYLPLMIEELETRKLPLELALLPMVESALNPQARSPVGATGLWQFMAPTAKRFELRSSRLVDDRKNLREATRAAMDYLGRLYAQFGDWHLAMAAYNWGEGSVAKAVAKQRAKGLPTDFNALAALMPAETRNYVPQIMALAQLVLDPQPWGTRLPDMPDGNPLVEVALTRDMDLKLVVHMAGISEKDFLALNAAVKPPLVLAKATPQLLLPQDAGARFERALASHSGKTTSWSVHTLDRTQPVEAIAARWGVSPQSVRDANSIPRGMKPVAGSAMLLPVASAAGSQVSAELVATASLQTTPDIVKVIATARAGETLAAVAKRMGVDAAKLAQWNSFSAKAARQKLKPGKTLVLWVVR